MIDRRAQPARGPGRCVALGALLGLVAAGQLLALLDRPLGPWPHAPVAFGLAAAVGLAAGAIAGRGCSPERDNLAIRLSGREATRGAAAGAAVWALWAGVYYLAGALAAGRARQLGGAWESSLPAVASASLVYLGVHPLSVSPALALATRPALRRHLAGQLVIVAVSATFWFLAPVSYPRGPIGEEGGLGAWVLANIQGHDPDVNCFPSTHCAMAIHAAWSLREACPRLGPWALATAVAIAASTLLTRQHYPVDVIAGLALGLAVIALNGRGGRAAPRRPLPRRRPPPGPRSPRGPSGGRAPASCRTSPGSIACGARAGR